MPRDVATRWNSTFDMLDFALQYRKAIDAIAAEREMGLRQFELSAKEWEIAGQLRDVLQVSRSSRSHDAFVESFTRS
jgi:hypothetical protein